MMDTEVLADFRAQVPPVDPAVLAAARARVLNGTGTSRGSVPRWIGPGRIALRWRLVAVGCAALVVVAGLLVAGNLLDPARVPVPTATPDTEAARILRHAALAAQSLPAAAPRADQFVFVESVTAYPSGWVGPDGKVVWDPPVPKLRQIWLSVDGTRDALLRERPQAGGDWTESPLSGPASPAARTDLPTGTDAMVQYLYHNSQGDNPPDEQAFITAGDLVRESYLPPAALSALWSATARIPGVTVVHDAVDAAGRHGVAVAYSSVRNVNQELIFDPTTYAFLGERDVATANGDGRTKGQVFSSSASMRIAIVDRPGQLP